MNRYLMRARILLQTTSDRKLSAFICAFLLFLTIFYFNGFSAKKRPHFSKFYSEQDGHDSVDILLLFTNAKDDVNLQMKFGTCVESLLRFASISLTLYVIGDSSSFHLAEKIISAANRIHPKENSLKIKVEHLPIESMANKLSSVIPNLQKHFSFKPGSQYSDALFFLSLAVHRVLPTRLEHVIMLDADLKIRDDIKNLHAFFNLFNSSQLIGVAREMQPVYRHLLHQYRSENPATLVGEPPPNGLSGFNSGVLLLDLKKMRQSQLYNSLLTEESLAELTERYHFKGHLGDQDFLTLISFDNSFLFYTLPCEWNRQLCTWWRDKGGYVGKEFDSFHNCSEPVRIYHGNCNTPIPKD